MTTLDILSFCFYGVIGCIVLFFITERNNLLDYEKDSEVLESPFVKAAVIFVILFIIVACYKVFELSIFNTHH